MVISHVFGLHSTPSLFFRMCAAVARTIARLWCGLSGHSIMMHFEPNRLSLQCALCGYQSEGWEVGRPMTARRHTNNPQAHPDRRRALRPLPSRARLAS